MLDKKLFITALAVVAQEVTLAGEKHTLHFKELPVKTFFDLSMKLSEPENRLLAAQELVYLSLCNEDGTDALTLERVGDLKLSVLFELVAAVQTVNGAKKN